MIKLLLEFRKYQFIRCNRSHSLKVEKDWVGKQVYAIPMPLDTSQDMIDDCLMDDGVHRYIVKTDTIFQRFVGDDGNYGRVYVPRYFMGVDFLIIEAEDGFDDFL